MCARFDIDGAVVEAAWQLSARQTFSPAEAPSGEICPADRAPVLRDLQGSPCADLLLWGYPRQDSGSLLINARSETILEKSLFQTGIRAGRCVVPARDFIEWTAEKEKVTFSLPEKPVLFMAGIYDIFSAERRFTVLTTAANDSVSPYHSRMPLLLRPDDIPRWLYGDYSALLHGNMPALEHAMDCEQLSLF